MKKILAVSCWLLAACPAWADITSNLEMWLRYTEGSGAIVGDYAGYGRDAAFAGTPTWASGPAAGHGALTLDGSTHVGTVGSSAPTFAGEFTVSAWVKRASTTTLDGWAGDVTGTQSLAFAADATTLSIRIVNAGTVFTPAHGVTSTNWHLLTVVRAANNEVTVYVDTTSLGVIGTVSGSSAWGRIANNSANSRQFHGDISEIRFYSRALSSGDVAELHTYDPTDEVADAPNSAAGAVKVTAFRDTLAAATGVDTFAVTGLNVATPHKAAMLFGNTATTDGTAADEALWTNSYVTDVLRRHCFTNRARHNIASSSVSHSASRLLAYGTLAAASNAFDPKSYLYPKSASEGFQDTGLKANVTEAAADARFVHGITFSGQGVQSHLTSVTVALAAAGTADVTIPWEPNLLIAQTDGDQLDESTGHNSATSNTICFIRNDGGISYAGQSHGWRYAGSAFECYGEVSNTNIIHVDPTWDLADHDWELTVSFPTALTLRVTTVVAGGEAEAPVFSFLLLKTGDRAVRVGVMDVPTSTGPVALGNAHFAPDIGFRPQAIVFLVNRLTTVDTFSGNSPTAGTLGMAVATRPAGIAAGAVEFCATQSSEQGAATTNTQSLSDDQLFNVPEDDGTNAVAATFTSFDSGGLTANFSTAPASTLKWPFLAIEAEAVSVTPYYYQQQSRVNQKTRVRHERDAYALAP